MQMKKAGAALLAILLLASLFPAAAFAAQTGKYRVISASAVLFAQADITSDKLGEVYAGAVLEVETVTRGFGRTTVRSSGITGWVQLSHLEYLGAAPESDVLGIRVTPPDRTTLVHGEKAPDLTGMKVYAVYDGGLQVAVTGYEVYFDAMDTLGEKEVRVTYTPRDSARTFTDSFKVTVVRYPVEKLTLMARPGRTLYMEHEKLDLSGLTVKLTYADGRPEQMAAWEDIAADPDFTVSGCCGEAHGQPLEKGTHTITVSYRYDDIAVSFPVSVTPRTLTFLSVARQPDSLVTHHRDRAPNVSGLLLRAEYDNGEVEEVDGADCEIVCDPASFVLGENNPVDVYFGGLSVRLYYKLSLNNVTGIRAVPSKTSFIAGQDVDPGLKVQLLYADGTFEIVTDYQMTEIDPEKEGSQNVIVTYGEYSDVFTVSITTFYRAGDVDGDGAVKPEDARLTLRASVGFIKFAGLAFQAADVDHDNAITPADARLILRASVGLEKL